MGAETMSQLDARHQALIEQRSAIGAMPMDTNEERLARYTARVEVNVALAAVYAAYQEHVQAGTVVSWALTVAENDSRDAARQAQERAETALARIEAARNSGGES
jgi:hypothetical protein